MYNIQYMYMYMYTAHRVIRVVVTCTPVHVEEGGCSCVACWQYGSLREGKWEGGEREGDRRRAMIELA